MPTVDEITFTTKRETFDIYDERLEIVYRKEMDRLAGQDNASGIAMKIAKDTIGPPRCMKQLKSICNGAISYVVIESKRDLRKRFWWIGLIQGMEIFHHKRKIFASTNICSFCATYMDAKGAGYRGEKIEETLETIQRGCSTEEEKERMRFLAKKAHAHGVGNRKKAEAEHGALRYRPRKRK